MKIYGFCFNTAEHELTTQDLAFHNASWLRDISDAFSCCQCLKSNYRTVTFAGLLTAKVNILLNLGLTIFGWGRVGGVALSSLLPGFIGGHNFLTSLSVGVRYFRGSLLSKVYGHAFPFLLPLLSGVDSINILSHDRSAT